MIKSLCQSLILFALLSASSAFAQEAAPAAAPAPALKNESELGISTVTGNANSESYTLKQLSTYKFDEISSMKAQGRYVQGRSNGVENVRAWEALIRYERALSEWWSVFLQQSAESDVYSGFVQRDNTDVGGKYFLTKNDATVWFAELGYRYSNTQYVVLLPGAEAVNPAARVYTEVTHNFSKGTAGKLWVEYIPSFKNADAYLVNGEPSVTATLSDTFSLKSSYLVKYQNPNTANRGLVAYTDATFLTSLLAKF